MFTLADKLRFATKYSKCTIIAAVTEEKANIIRYEKLNINMQTIKIHTDKSFNDGKTELITDTITRLSTKKSRNGRSKSAYLYFCFMKSSSLPYPSRYSFAVKILSQGEKSGIKSIIFSPIFCMAKDWSVS